MESSNITLEKVYPPAPIKNSMKVKIEEIIRGDNPEDWLEVVVNNPKITYGISDAQWNSIRNYKVTLGMTRPMVRLVLGDPDRKEVFTFARGAADMWLYNYNYSNRIVIYTFVNGILDSISEK